MKLLKYLFLGLNILLTCVTLLCYLSPHISPFKNETLPVFGLLFPFTIFLHILFIFLWLFSQKKWALISVLTLLAGYNSLNKLISFSGSIDKADSKEIFTLSSYNVARMQLIHKKPKDKFYQHVRKLYSNNVILFQEASPAFIKEINKQYPKAHTLSFPRKSIFFLSHFPIIDSGLLDFGVTENACAWADIDVHGQKIRIYNAHLQSNSITKIVNEVAEHVDLNSQQDWQKIQNLISRYNETTSIRLQQTKIIKKHIESSPHPVILGGDMNDVPQSYVYSELSKGMDDAFIERGNGMGTSFGGSIPALRIDYLFSKQQGVRFLDFHTIRAPFSDHYAIQSRIEFLP